MLHIIKSQQAITDAVLVVDEGDNVLLIEEAVYAANPQHHLYMQLKGFSLFALQADLAARGISGRVSPSIEVISYLGFVELTAENAQSITWN